MKPHIGITDKNLKNSIDLLSLTLADAMTLYTKTRKFHWNVSGESFMEMHVLFENQYKVLEVNIDEIAERIGKLGGKTIGTMAEFAEMTRLKEAPNVYPAQKDMVKELLSDHEAVAVQLRKDITTSEEENSDAGTADFLTALLLQHESTAWKLRRYLN
ncbi:Dps family protein [Flavobacterium sp. PL002]|uniref:Dps family protein n=1 Tax=Flavobacterium sp. PL002 TaxID=1897058 RepID=UPI001787E57A|nr:DNA starvation/stationary phase protection protein [Flavobacterium sp. PL002]MBE0393324.1 DNA protection during starvation protein 2 [Flavobacterium sp. PL002]